MNPTQPRRYTIDGRITAVEEVGANEVVMIFKTTMTDLKAYENERGSIIGEHVALMPAGVPKQHTEDVS